MATALKGLQKRKHILISDKKNSLTDIWEDLLDHYSDITAVVDRYNKIKLTYKELYETICCFASGLQSLGLSKGDHVCLFSENSSKWLITDQAILMAGGVDAVRGSQAPAEELFYILKHSDSKGLIIENLETFNKLLPYLGNYSPDFIICLADKEIPPEIKDNHNIYSFNQIISIGKRTVINPVQINKDDVATLVYTSGTTGKPKGVMITHRNFLSQITALADILDISPEETSLNILPTWHIYERTCEYYLISCGITMNYTNAANFKEDIKRYKPNYLVAVPRVWEAVYNGIHIELKKQPAFRQNLINFLLKSGEIHIKAKRILNNMCIDNVRGTLIDKIKAFAAYCLTYPAHKLGEKLVYKKLRSAFGGNLLAGVSGGGTLAGRLEDFYETIGVEIIVGYGLTESSPVLTIRKKGDNMKKSAGKPLAGTKIKIVNPENKKEAGFLQSGLVMAKGPQIMKGYYKNQEAADQVLSADGWLNTGDLGWLTLEKNLILTGRDKDIIVLSNGENVEPQPLEDACSSSPYINQIILVGQDKNSLGALIFPNFDSLRDWAKKHSVNYADDSGLCHNQEIHKLFKKELSEYIKKRPNYKTFEKIQQFKLIEEPFTVENGLMTQTMKIKKAKIQEKYKDLIEEMFKG